MKHSLIAKVLFTLLASCGLLSSIAQTGYAQDKLFTLTEVTPGGEDFLKSYYPKYLPGIQWLNDRAIWIENNQIVGQKINEGKSKVLLTLADLKKLLPLESFAEGERIPYGKAIPNSTAILIEGQEGYYVVDAVANSLLCTFPKKNHLGESFEAVAFSALNSVAVMRSEKGVLTYVRGATPRLSEPIYKPIAPNEGDAIVYGEAVHQREFGINTGVFISPNGKRVAFYRMDQSMVAPYPLVDYSPHKAVYKPLRYPMAGEPSHHVTVGVFDSETGKTSYLQTGGNAETYLTNIAWVPDNRGIVLAEINRAQNKLEMKLFDSVFGVMVRKLFTEKEEKYLDPSIAPIFLPNEPEDFLWVSRRDGYYHFYHYDLTGKLFNQVTTGNWEVLDFKGFTPNGKGFLFTATKASPLEERLYSIELSGGTPKDLTPEEGVHTVQYSRSAGAFIDSYCAPRVPRTIALRSIVGKGLSSSTILLQAPDPTQAYNMPTIEQGTLTAADGETPLYYRLLKPINFDPNKKYPAIVYVYGGPHAQMIHKGWLYDASGWDVYMAQQGFVVFTLDNRGSANRGKEFEQAIWRQVGTNEMKDQMEGVKFLLSHDWVDASRLGVYGWSFGGFMTTNLLLTYPHTFKVGVAGGPVMDWSRYEIMYGERYNGSPQSNPEGYRKNNLTLRAGDLQDRLLLIQGVEDNVVVWQHSMAFMKKAISSRSYPDCYYYPTHEHNVRGRDRVHLHHIIVRYFKDFL